jgi:hypothetical protein
MTNKYLDELLERIKEISIEEFSPKKNRDSRARMPTSIPKNKGYSQLR